MEAGYYKIYPYLCRKHFNDMNVPACPICNKAIEIQKLGLVICPHCGSIVYMYLQEVPKDIKSFTLSKPCSDK